MDKNTFFYKNFVLLLTIVIVSHKIKKRGGQNET